MNYFAHGRPFLEEPYVLAGTAVPDWLNVVNRRVRVRGKQAAAFVSDGDPQTAAVARGIVRHHQDDGWFHGTRAFAELSLAFAVEIRDLLPDDEGFRPSFLGHVLVEVLLDATLIEAEPGRLDDYYRTVAAVDPAAVAAAVEQMAGRPVKGLPYFIGRFAAERFLSDYADDAKLWWRLNQVMRRVRLPLLPERFCDLLPAARRNVAARKDELLTPADNCLSDSGAIESKR